MEVRLSGKKSIYEEIVETYARYIATGALRAGEKLPSCRALAMQLGINPNTVERAYSELEKRGLIRTLPKKGAFVLDTAKPPGVPLAEAEHALLKLKDAGLTAAEAHALIDRLFGSAEGGNGQ